MSASKGSGDENLVGCLYFVGIIFALALWQVTLVLIVIGGIYFAFNIREKAPGRSLSRAGLRPIDFRLVVLTVSTG